MTTWMQVMAVVKDLDERRRRGPALDGRDAERLVTMLLDFHRDVVIKTPSSDTTAAVRSPEGRPKV
jgi:hypothetical protein